MVVRMPVRLEVSDVDRPPRRNRVRDRAHSGGVRMSTDFWTTRRDSPKVQAALKVACKLCGAKAGDDCRSVGDARKALRTGVIHMVRVPDRVMGVKK